MLFDSKPKQKSGLYMSSWNHDNWLSPHRIHQGTGGGRWTFFQNFTSLAITVWEWSWFEDILSKFHQLVWRYFHKGSLDESIIDKGVCRTSQATPGLLTRA